MPLLVKVMKHSTLYGFNLEPNRSKGYEEKLAQRDAVDTLVKQGGLKRIIGSARVVLAYHMTFSDLISLFVAIVDRAPDDTGCTRDGHCSF